jgi:hypothetical protein
MVKNVFESLIDLNKLSFLILSFAYIGINADLIIFSPYYNTYYFVFLLLSLTFIDLINNYFCQLLGKWYEILSLVLISFLLYGFFFLEIISFVNEIIGFNLIRLRFLLIISVLLSTIFSRQIVTKFKYLNVFLIIFGLVSLLNNYIKTDHKFNRDNFTSLINEKKIGNQNKPLILIIVDEYHSPDEIFKLMRDSSSFELVNFLKKNQWAVRSTSKSLETSTIHSIGSIFNFNTSYNKGYKKLTPTDIGAYFLDNNELIKSLRKKKVAFNNYGIFSISKVEPLNSLYRYPTSFLSSFYVNTGLYMVFDNINLDYQHFFADVNFKFSIHNKKILSKRNFDTTKSFTYAHLFMPHAPYVYENEYNDLNKGFNSYVKFWAFTNKKLIPFLTELCKNGEFKIILTGDHGFRGEKKLNPSNTFTALYGFQSSEITNFKTVQDLGFIIDSNFQNTEEY